MREKIHLFRKPLISPILLPFIFEVIKYDFKLLWLIIIPILIFALEVFFNDKINYKIKVLTICILFITLYTQILFDDTKFIIHDLRLRYFSLLIIFISGVIYLYPFLFKISFKFHNIIFLNLTIVMFVNNIYVANKTFSRDDLLNKLNYKFQDEKLSPYKKSDKPIILIVLDELSSSQEIFNITKDSIDFKLNNYLTKNEFISKNNFKSLSLRTSISIPSLFNFNFHNNIKKDSIENIDKGLQVLEGYSDLIRNNLLVDSLNKKNITSYSFGITSFSKGINNDSFYYYWDNKNPNQKTYERIINKTIIGTFLSNIKRETSQYDKFRKDGLNFLSNTNFNEKSFYYFHLYFPHDPFSYYEEYPAKNLNYYTISENKYLEEHINYRRWFTIKFIEIIDKIITKNNNVRIIITGDHGFRFNKKINPEYTDSYYRGFDLINIDSYNFIQDLGYLIYKSF